MAAFQTSDLQCVCFFASFHSFFFHRQCYLYSSAAAAAYQEFAFFFRVHINEISTLQIRNIQCFCAVHTCFFICGKHNFHKRMFQCCAVQHCQHECNSNTVISAQSCTFCADHITINFQLKRVFCEIMFHTAQFFTYHIDMSLKHNRSFVFCPLENYARSLFIARCRSFLNNHIVRFISAAFQSSFFGKVHDILCQCSFVAAAMRDFCDFLKIIKYFVCSQSI